MSLADEFFDVPRGQEYRTWKTNVLIRYRDDQLEAITRLKRMGIDPYPLPAVVRMIESELSKREFDTPLGRLQCVADVGDLS